MALAVPTETTPFTVEAATSVKKELPDCAVVIELAPNATEFVVFAVASLPNATASLAFVFALKPTAIDFSPEATVASAMVAPPPIAIAYCPDLAPNVPVPFVLTGNPDTAARPPPIRTEPVALFVSLAPVWPPPSPKLPLLTYA